VSGVGNTKRKIFSFLFTFLSISKPDKMRKLATIRKIENIHPILGADAIECAEVDGWKAVIKKNEFQVSEHVIYAEIDSWIPTTIAPFLSKGKDPKVYSGIPGERLKTMKLRGQLSQGLILPLHIIKDKLIQENILQTDESNLAELVGFDLTDLLGIMKWDPPVIEESYSEKGISRKQFPGHIPKTDQERIQNLKNELMQWQEKGYTWEITEKIDGTSCTVFFVSEEEKGICSRNQLLNLIPEKEGEEEGEGKIVAEMQTPSNLYWDVVIREGILEKLQSCGRGLAVQGEIIAPKIQKNLYKLQAQERRFYVFDIYDIKAGCKLSPIERREFCQQYQLLHVPVLEENYKIPVGKPLHELLVDAQGLSQLHKIEREGIVFKCNEWRGSFKCISNNYLLSHN
jgi:RNA ligase (TIGR02306 family)